MNLIDRGESMPYFFEFDRENRILRGKLTGKVDHKIMWQYADEMNAILKQEDARLFLADYRESQIPFSTIEIFYIPEQLNEVMKASGINLHTLKRALLFTNKNHELVQFFENVATNRGQWVKAFTDESEAIEWLLK
jgi:hypothetical protein